MTTHIATGGIHHLTLTVTDVERSAAFYSELLGFQRALTMGPRILLGNGNVILALTPNAAPAQAQQVDRFDERRVGLDHLSFTVTARRDLEAAMLLFDAHAVPRGEIKDLGEDLGLYVLAFRDPDNIQLELTAPYDLTHHA